MDFGGLIMGLAEKMGIGGEIEIDDEQRCLLEFDDMGVVIQGVDAADTCPRPLKKNIKNNHRRSGGVPL